MNADQVAVIKGCAALSLDGRITFPEVVQRLAAVGVERYHTDYTRGEVTYYMPDGASLVVPTLAGHSPNPVAPTFSAKGVEAAVRESQRGDISYREFIRKTSGAGCVGYFAQISGRRVIYFGRQGETHVEVFGGMP